MANNNKKAYFAVCLAAFNGMEYIADQIESILLQRNVDLQIFISVDRSTDGTEVYLTEWALTEPRLTLLPFGDQFGGAGPNFYRILRDVDLTGFDYLSFADQDDIWHSEKLWRAHSLLVELDAASYSSNVTAFWPDGRTELIDKAQPQRHWDFLFEAAGPGCTYVMRRDLACAVQAMVRSQWTAVQSVVLHDWLSYAYARANGYKWVIDEQVGMQYRQHAANQVGVNAGWTAFAYRLRMVLGGWGITQAERIASLVGLDGTSFVRRWKTGGRVGFLWLAINANQCRRRGRDRLYFSLSCLMMAVLSQRHKS